MQAEGRFFRSLEILQRFVVRLFINVVFMALNFTLFFLDPFFTQGIRVAGAALIQRKDPPGFRLVFGNVPDPFHGLVGQLQSVCRIVISGLRIPFIRRIIQQLGRKHGAAHLRGQERIEIVVTIPVRIQGGDNLLRKLVVHLLDKFRCRLILFAFLRGFEFVGQFFQPFLKDFDCGIEVSS